MVLPRSLELVLSLVAILRAGAAYLPIDPEHPLDRQSRTLGLAQPAVVITTGDTAVTAPDGCAVISIALGDAALAVDTRYARQPLSGSG